MARVLALGGCGGLGRYAVRTLLRDARVERVVVADRDGARAAAFAIECGPRVEALMVDVTDGVALRRAMEDADIVMSAVGPYTRFGVPILEACIEVGRSYVDVCDDPQPTLAMLALGRAAEQRGVTAIVGLGITPGVSNLLALVAACELDEVEVLITGWDLESAMPETVGPEPSAATVHGVEQLSGRIRVRRGGRDVDEAPLRKVRFDYPGLGACHGYTIGHPEPVTLPLRFPKLRECLNVMTARPATVVGMRALSVLVGSGIVSRQRAARWAERVGGPGGKTPSLIDLAARARATGRMSLPPIFALARGRRAGAPATAATMLLGGPAGGMGALTGIPLAIGAGLLARGELARPGVWAPEAVLDATDFLDRLAPLCDPPAASGSALVLTTRSWETTTLLHALEKALARLGAA